MINLDRENQHIAILGAGLAGSLLALLLRNEGFKVSVYEKRIDPRETKIPEGKSINLALSHRGIRALEHANAFTPLKDHLIPMNGRMMHDHDGKLTFLSYGTEGQFINSVSRNELNLNLINQAEKSGVSFHFGYKCERVNLEKTEFVVSNNGKYYTHNTDVVFGADGAFSALRKSMLPQDRFDYQQMYIGHGYKELAMPPRNGDFAMEPNYLHIWPRGNFMLIALPNPDKTFTCTLFLGFEGEESWENLTDDKSVLDFFHGNFPDMTSKIPDLLEQFHRNPTSSLITVRCQPWHHKRCMLIGDAAHAIVPFYGQGMNAAFEDCRLFVEMGKEMNFDWDRLLQTFSGTRKKDADAIADLALRNFIEMRDQVADSSFLERKTVDARLHEKFANDWIPMYSMVTFSDIPYHLALKKGLEQEKALIDAQQNNYLSNLEKIKRSLAG